MSSHVTLTIFKCSCFSKIENSVLNLGRAVFLTSLQMLKILGLVLNVMSSCLHVKYGHFHWDHLNKSDGMTDLQHR